MAKAALKRSRRTKKTTAAHQRGRKRPTKITRARKTATQRRADTPAARGTPPALKRERRTLSEEPTAASTPETPASNTEPRTAGEASSGQPGPPDGAEEERVDWRDGD